MGISVQLWRRTGDHNVSWVRLSLSIISAVRSPGYGDARCDFLHLFVMWKPRNPNRCAREHWVRAMDCLDSFYYRSLSFEVVLSVSYLLTEYFFQPSATHQPRSFLSWCVAHVHDLSCISHRGHKSLYWLRGTWKKVSTASAIVLSCFFYWESQSRQEALCCKHIFPLHCHKNS